MDSAPAQAYWDLPGRIVLRPTGRLRVEAPLRAGEGYWVGKDKMPPSAYRVRCWQLMDEAAELAPLLAPKESWRSIDDLVKLDREHDAGRAHVRRIETLAELLDPVTDEKLIAQLMSGTADDGPITPFLAERILLFASYVWHECLIEKRPALVGAGRKLAKLLGCGHRSACTVVALADKKGLVRRLPQSEDCPYGFLDRGGKVRMQRRDTNAYEPGVVMRVAWMRGGRPQRPKATPAPSVTPPATVRAQAVPAIPRGSREDRMACDPGPREEFITGGVSDGATAAPAPPPPPAPPAPAPAQDAVPANDRGQARGFAASQSSINLGGGVVPPYEHRPAVCESDTKSPRQGTVATAATGGGLRDRFAPAHAANGTPAAGALANASDRPSDGRGQPSGRMSKMQASDGTSAVARAAAGRAVITPAEARMLPAWYTEQLAGAMRSGDPRAACADLLERAALWLRLTEGGTLAHEIDAVVERMRRAQARRRKRAGPAVVCSRQGGEP